MKIDRRSFLSFVIGGAAGTALSPLPWKLTDDIAIWTQNWPWTPVPERGPVSFVNSVCTLCPGGCGITIRKVGRRVVKIEGTADYPVNHGGLCPLGLSGGQLLYGAARRIPAPLKKTDGGWMPISWDAALSEVAQRLGDLRSKGLAHTVACIAGSDRGTVPALWQRFLTVYGSPNFIRTPSIQDPYELVLELMQGVRAFAGFDVAASDFVISFGSGLFEGWGSPVYMLRAVSALRDNGGRLVQVEPRLSMTAAKADQWLAVNPGTEGTLALGLARVIIREKLYHRDFVENHTTGFDQWRQRVMADYAPGEVARATGVDATEIVALARAFAKARHPLAICGQARGLAPGGLNDFLAVHALNALVGSINRPGGVRALAEPDYINWPEPEIDAAAARGLQQPRVDGAGGSKYPLARYLLERLPKIINSSRSCPVKMLFVTDANPLYSLPDVKAARKAFERIPFVVSFSSYLDETARQADLILPNHMYLERYQEVPPVPGVAQPVIGLMRPAVKPQYNTRHEGDVVIQLARRLGATAAAAFPWSSYKACLESTLADVLQSLLKRGYLQRSAGASSGWEDAFETDSGKFEFTNAAIAALPPRAAVAPVGAAASFPLLLVGYDSPRLAGGYIGDPPFLIKTVSDFVLKKNDGLVEINPATAGRLGLAEGSRVVLSTPLGQARARVHLFDGIRPGMVALPRGLGHTAYDPYLAGKGINLNALMGPVEDPASGLNAAWSIRAGLVKA